MTFLLPSRASDTEGVHARSGLARGGVLEDHRPGRFFMNTPDAVERCGLYNFHYGQASAG